MPLALFLERLSILISTSSVEVDVNHTAGKSNDLVCEQMGPELGFATPISDRFRLELSDIWSQTCSASLVPADAWIPWSIP